jgi:hypothetical protein
VRPNLRMNVEVDLMKRVPVDPEPLSFTRQFALP